MPLLSTYIDVRTVKFFSPTESWLVNSNFPRASRLQGRRCENIEYAIPFQDLKIVRAEFGKTEKDPVKPVKFEPGHILMLA